MASMFLRRSIHSKKWILPPKTNESRSLSSLSMSCYDNLPSLSPLFSHDEMWGKKSDTIPEKTDDIVMTPPAKDSSMIGMGRVFISGSGIGSDTSMVSSNNRWKNHVHNCKTQKNKINARSFLFGKTNQHVFSQVSIKAASIRHYSAAAGKSDVAMDDEYGEMTTDGETYEHPTPFELENGQVLQEACLRYQTYGTLNQNRDNVIVICHALTGNASLHSWWGEMLGPSLAFDTSKYFVVCANILGSCYGSTSPTSPNPSSPTNQPYLSSFPDISVRDTVRLQLHMLKNDLNINSVKSVIGGSFGGMQTLEFALLAGSVDSEFITKGDGRTTLDKPFIRTSIPIACGAAHTAWQIAISETQRQAIYADPKWNNGNVDMNDPPLSGLEVARQIGMVSYRTAKGYEQKFGRSLQKDSESFYGSNAKWQVKSYLEYQGQKFLSRFDPVTYVKLTEQMDTHDVGRNRGGNAEALSKIDVPTLVLGIDSDVLYPLHEQVELANLIPNAQMKIIRSDAGHDGFLLEQEQVGNHIIQFLNEHD